MDDCAYCTVDAISAPQLRFNYARSVMQLKFEIVVNLSGLRDIARVEGFLSRNFLGKKYFSI